MNTGLRVSASRSARNDRPRQGADVGAAVARISGLILTPPHEIARTCGQATWHRAAEAGLADAGLPIEEDRSRRVGLSFARRGTRDGLDLLEVVVPGRGPCGRARCRGCPRSPRSGQLTRPLEVGPDDAVPGGRRRGSRAAELAVALLAAPPPAVRLSPACAIVTSAACSSSSPSALDPFAARAACTRAGLSSSTGRRTGLGPELDQLELASEISERRRRPLADVSSSSSSCFSSVEIRRAPAIRWLSPRLVHVRDRELQLSGRYGICSDDLAEGVLRRCGFSAWSSGFHPGRRRELVDPRHEIRVLRDVVADLDPRPPLDEDAQRAVVGTLSIRATDAATPTS